MPLIGTAGHVDHGKSTLVMALTGRDPDRLDAEKERGLTIDLGFAWADLGDGQEVSFVDVPGHERYLKNMLAGIDVVDVALLVVAANEGWMPQTEEHLAILDLLDVRSGVVALTKIDLVDEERLHEAAEEVNTQLEGTSLAGAPVVPISAPQGLGVDELRHELLKCVRGVTTDSARRPRLWVDRSFSIVGAGTIVTGSLLGGEVSQGDRVVVDPPGVEVRVRSIETHEKSVETAQPGYRVALGVSGVDARVVERGSMVGLPGQWTKTDRVVVRLRPARYAEGLPERGALQVHVGTAIVNAEVTRLHEDRAIIKLAAALPLASGDRLVVRDTGRRLVVAGGTILDPHPVRGSLTATWPVSPTADEVATQLLELRGIEELDRLGAESNGGEPVSAVVIGTTAITSSKLDRAVEECERIVASDHLQNPLRDGLPMATLINTVGLPRAIVEEAVRRSGALELRGPNVAETAHRAALDAEAEGAWDRARAMLADDLAVPGVSELNLSQDLVHMLVRRGELVRVSDDLVFLPEQISRVTETAQGLPAPFGVGDFKDALGLSRKYAMPLLEWLDSNDYTIRRPEGRVPGPRSSSGQE